MAAAEGGASQIAEDGVVEAFVVASLFDQSIHLHQDSDSSHEVADDVSAGAGMIRESMGKTVYQGTQMLGEVNFVTESGNYFANLKKWGVGPVVGHVAPKNWMLQTVAAAAAAKTVVAAAFLQPCAWHGLAAAPLSHDWGLEDEGDEGYQVHGIVVGITDVAAGDGLDTFVHLMKLSGQESQNSTH